MNFDIGTWLYGFVAGGLLTYQVTSIIHKVLAERDES